MNNALQLPDNVTALEVYSTDGGLDPYVQQARDALAEFEPDTSTAKGRAQIASFSRKMSTLKVKLDDLGKELTADKKKEIAVVDKSRKAMRDQMDEIRDQARQPLTDWEEADRRRIARIEQQLAAIKEIRVNRASADELEQFRELLYVDFDFEEFADEADHLIDSLKRSVETEFKAIEQRKAEAERAEKERIEREEKLAEETRAREAAEAKQAEQEAEIARLKAINEKAERDRIEAEESARRAEQEAADEKARAERAEVAERERIEAERVAKIEREKEEKAAAERAEKQAEIDAQNRKAQARLAVEQREQFINDLCAELRTFCTSGAAAKRLAVAIIDGKIPHITAERLQPEATQ